jgi:hypothetical protein
LVWSEKTHNQKMWPFNLNLTYFEDFFWWWEFERFEHQSLDPNSIIWICKISCIYKESFDATWRSNPWIFHSCTRLSNRGCTLGVSVTNQLLVLSHWVMKWTQDHLGVVEHQSLVLFFPNHVA